MLERYSTKQARDLFGVVVIGNPVVVDVSKTETLRAKLERK